MSNGLEQGIRQGHGFNDVARDARQLVFSHRKSVAAKDNVSDRKRQEAEAARRKHEASKLGFSAGKKRVSIHQLERTNRGKRVEGIAAIQKEVQRSKHVKEKSNLSKRDVKEFLAGPAGLPLSGNAASDEDAGLTWLAASTTGAHGSKKLQTVRSESEQKQARIALQTLPALRTVAQRRLVREIIASVDLFSNLSHREIDSLTELIKVDAFDEGDVIMTEGEPGDEFCIVFSGGVDIIIGGRHVRKAKSHGSRARMYTMRNHNSKQTIKDVGRTRSSTVSHGSIATTASMPPPARPRRNVHDDQPAMLRSRMTKEQLKEWDGVTVGHLNPGATFGELALLDAKGVRTAVRPEDIVLQPAHELFVKADAALCCCVRCWCACWRGRARGERFIIDCCCITADNPRRNRAPRFQRDDCKAHSRQDRIEAQCVAKSLRFQILVD